MKALLYKDLMLLKTQRTGLIIMLIVGVILSLTSTNGMGAVAFCSFIMMMCITSTFSLDGYNNFLTYLLTLPISRKLYIQSKYIFALFALLITWLCSLGISLISSFFNPNLLSFEVAMASLLIPIVVMIAYSTSIPFLVKFGPEKGRIIMAGVMGIIVGISVYIAQIRVDLSFDFDQSVSMGYLLVIAIIVCLIVVFISYQFSIKFIDRKDY